MVQQLYITLGSSKIKMVKEHGPNGHAGKYQSCSSVLNCIFWNDRNEKNNRCFSDREDNISIVKARCLKSICGLRRVVFLIELTVTFYAVLKSIEGCCICSCKFAVLLFNEILTFSSINKSTKNINKRLRS